MKLILKSSDGRLVECLVKKAMGVVHLELWEGENTHTVQCMSMQNGQMDMCLTSSVVDCPISSVTYYAMSTAGQECTAPGKRVRVVGPTDDIEQLLVERVAWKILKANSLLVRDGKPKLVMALRKMLS
jgi:hypothetical protein